MDAQEAVQGREDLVTTEEFPLSATGLLGYSRGQMTESVGQGAPSRCASPKAAAAARPPMMTVCNPLRTTPAPVTRPLTAPKSSKAKRVMPTEAGSAV